MKKYSIIQLFSYSIILNCFLFGCHSTGSHADEQSQNNFTPDSLWTPTGNAELDSLLQLAAVAPRDTNLVRIYADIGDLYFYSLSDCEKSKEYQFKLKELSEELHWSKGFYIFAAGFSNLLRNEGLLDSMIVIQQEALELAKKEKNEIRIALTLENLGLAYSDKNCNETALEYYFQALAIYEKSGDKYDLAYIYSYIGWCYNEMGMSDMSISYYEKALLIYDETPNSKNRAYALINYSCLLRDLHEFEKAEKCLLEAERICEFLNNNYHLISVYINLANVKMAQNDWDKAEKYFDKAMVFILEFDNVEDYCIVNRGYAAIAMYRGNFNKSEKYIREALKTAVEYDMTQQIIKCYDNLTNLTSAQHDFINHRLYSEIADSLNNELISEETRFNAKELETKYETEKKELEIKHQQQIIVRHIRERWLLIAIVAICVIVLALLWFLLRLRDRRNRELTEINATKDRLFSIISHDLKNPALDQRDAIQLLLDNKAPKDTDALNNYYQKMLKSADEQIDLLYNLLNWARIQTKQHYQLVEFDFAAELRKNEFSLLRNMANNKEIELIINIPNTAFVTGNASLLATVIRNLLENAVKFTPAGGQVTLSVEPKKNGKFIVSVADTGIGINDEQMKNLFRLDRQTTKRGTAGETGTGLGLIVCKELLDKHGTTLHIESKINEGSRFWFEI